ncbi:hypothetical protein J1C56_28415 [Aminobacter anthyllidis]|uniref:Uncharacterized protein n=1 Tax=Aminobacter anthyllidis TaxID=1035067 RepID=A0A9X1AH29_9HYPH|nr:hypothetical protein [Aminobacter anthyllidis]MBT1159493.1 hypothetical protein [Aminobacter anthyllidis]
MTGISSLAKTLPFAGQALRPAVLNQSPIRDADTVSLCGFGHIEAFGSRLPILLCERSSCTDGSAADCSNKSVRDSERETIGNAEEIYRRFVATWKQQSPKGRSSAAHEVRRS